MNPTKLTGISASPGVALGPAYPLRRHARLVPPHRHLEASSPGLDAAQDEAFREKQRLREALDQSDEQLATIGGRIPENSEHALILEAHRMMLRDPTFVAAIERTIDEDRINAEWALARVAKKIKASFDAIEDPYLRERRADLGYVADRLLRNLMGEKVDLDGEDEPPEGAIVIAHDLSPADVALLLKKGPLAGIVTELGGPTSHFAIVARARQIPAVVGVQRATDLIVRDDRIALDGQAGTVIVNPSEAQREKLDETFRQHLADEVALHELSELPTITTDRLPIRLLANIEFAEELPALRRFGADGVGLYRTEFLYLERNEAPTEEEQYEAYKTVLEQMEGRPVTIRTLDLGADKLPRGGLKRREKELNPALGLRAVRYCLKNRDLFMLQLKALLRASVHGDLKIMFPMISGLTELREAKALLARAKEELARDGHPFEANIPVGIMIETPAAAWAADRLALESDFFSIGTNDLIQYTLAIDRQNREVAYLYKPLHIAILRTLRHIFEAARQAEVPVSMCGEMAGDPIFTLMLLGLGLRDFSMAPAQIPLVKRLIREVSLAEGECLMEQAFRLHTAEEIERLVRTHMQPLLARMGLCQL